MKEMSAFAAKRQPPKPAKPKVEIKYTINGEQMSFRDIFALAKKLNPELSSKTLSGRLDRGVRDLKRLAADRLPHYRPKSMRG